MRKPLRLAAPWLPWLIPGAVNLPSVLPIGTTPTTAQQIILAAVAATITINITIGRRVTALHHAFTDLIEQAPVTEALLRGYQLALQNQSAAIPLPHAVGETATLRNLPDLRLIKTPGTVYRSQTATTEPTQEHPRVPSPRPLRPVPPR